LVEHPDLVARWVATHAELTRWIGAHPDEAKQLANDELKRRTGKRVPDVIMDEAWSRVTFTTDPIQPSLDHVARAAFAQGFLGRRMPDLSRIVDGRWLSGLTLVSEERAQP
jgi:NitT/TauT family transport system substrate-binding protein